EVGGIFHRSSVLPDAERLGDKSMADKREAKRRRRNRRPARPACPGEACIGGNVRHITDSRILLTEEGGTEEQTSGSPNLPDGESLMGPQPVGKTEEVMKTLTA